MGLAPGIVREGVENAKRGRVQLQREPHCGRPLLIGQRQSAFKKLFDLLFFPRFRFQGGEDADANICTHLDSCWLRLVYCGLRFTEAGLVHEAICSRCGSHGFSLGVGDLAIDLTPLFSFFLAFAAIGRGAALQSIPGLTGPFPKVLLRGIVDSRYIAATLTSSFKYRLVLSGCPSSALCAKPGNPFRHPFTVSSGLHNCKYEHRHYWCWTNWRDACASL